VPGLGDGRLKATKPELAEALTGRFSEHHGFLAKMHLDLIDSDATRIVELTARIQTYVSSDRPDPPQRPGLGMARELLASIPGISTTAAEQILAEIGTDISVFPSPGRLASWAGVAPGPTSLRAKSRPRRAGPEHLSETDPGGPPPSAPPGPNARSWLPAIGASCPAADTTVPSSRSPAPFRKPAGTSCPPVGPITTSPTDYYTKRRPGAAIKQALQRLRDAGCQITSGQEGILIIPT